MTTTTDNSPSFLNALTQLEAAKNEPSGISCGYSKNSDGGTCTVHVNGREFASVRLESHLYMQGLASDEQGQPGVSINWYAVGSCKPAQAGDYSRALTYAVGLATRIEATLNA